MHSVTAYPESSYGLLNVSMSLPVDKEQPSRKHNLQVSHEMEL